MKNRSSNQVGVTSPAVVGARYIVPSSQLDPEHRIPRMFTFEPERRIQIVWGNFSYCRLSTVRLQLPAVNSAERTHYYPLPTTHCLLNSPCGGAKRAPGARANIAAQLPTLL
ncbi:MAG: hypothetical protein WBE70_10810, partial [Candidatus Acidiferrum sp.]